MCGECDVDDIVIEDEDLLIADIPPTLVAVTSSAEASAPPVALKNG